MIVYNIPLCRIEPNGITITDYKIYDQEYTPTKNLSNLLEYKNTSCPYTHFSAASKKRLKRALLLLISTSTPQSFIDRKTGKKIKFLLNFITLTLSAHQGNYTDYDIKSQLLNSFLTDLRRKKGLKSYIWRAEPQKNNNIHFHIMTNQFFDYQFIRDTWNNVQKKLGFIDLFNEKHHHIDPNSTDIHSVYKIQKVGAYISKYVSKIDEDSRNIEGRIWDCSKNLKTTNKCLITCYDEELEHFNSLVERFRDRILTFDFCKFIPLSAAELKYWIPPHWYHQYINFLDTVRAG